MVPAFTNWESRLRDGEQHAGHAGKIGQFLDMMIRCPASRLFISSDTDTKMHKQWRFVDMGLLMCVRTFKCLYEEEKRLTINNEISPNAPLKYCTGAGVDKMRWQENKRHFGFIRHKL